MCLKPRQYGVEEKRIHFHWLMKITKKQVEQFMEYIYEWKEIYNHQNYVKLNKEITDCWKRCDKYFKMIKQGCPVEDDMLEEVIEGQYDSLVFIYRLYNTSKREYEFMLFCRKRNMTWKEQHTSMNYAGFDIDEYDTWEDIYNDNWRWWRWRLSRNLVESEKARVEGRGGVMMIA